LAIGTAPRIEFGRPYNAGSCKSVSVAQLIELVRELTGCRKPLEHEPGRTRPSRSEVRALLADSTRLTAVTGWRPETDLREGLKRTIAWWRDRLVSGRLRQDADFVA
jgi:UDP-glucose 4-epimerase